MNDNLFLKEVNNDLEQSIKELFLKSTNNLSWLKKGDIVLLKPAINSSNHYPATTHPLVLKILSKEIIKKGGKVIVGDQSGMEHVVHTPKGVIKGDSKEIFNKLNIELKDSKFINFEGLGWNKGFFNFKSEKTKSWKNGFYITNIIKKVDHIINLPRLSTHVQAGVTLGFKNLVGLLRQDSRLEFHNNGPFSIFINLMNKNNIIKFNNDNKDLFFEKIVEIFFAIKNKLRLTLFVATKAQTTFGPDKEIIPLLGKANVVNLNPSIVFASQNILSAEIFALKELKKLYKLTPNYKKLLYNIVISLNSQIKGLDKEDIFENRFIKHGLRLKIGDKNFKIIKLF